MTRFALAITFAALLAGHAFSQNAAPKPKSIEFDELGKLLIVTGFKTETGQGVYKVTLPGDDGWFLEVWQSKSAPLVLVTFPCQGLPAGKVEPGALLQLLAQNGRLDGAYFGYNEKTKNFYLESSLAAEGLTAAKLKTELDRLQKLAVKTAEFWDTDKWKVEKPEKK